MKRFDRLLCIACSFVPAVAVWLSYRRYQEFVSAFQDVLSFDRTFTFRTTFVLETIHFWPYLVVLGWLLLVPAMLAKTWAQKFRVVLMCCFLVLGPVLYAICLDGLFDPTLNVAKAVTERRESMRQPSVGRDSGTRAEDGAVPGALQP
jgi:hypothetical protein